MRSSRLQYREAISRCEAVLPAEITSIKPQKRRMERFSIYHNDLYLIGVSADTLLSFKLVRGMQLTPSLFSRIDKAEQSAAVREYLLRLLGRRDHSRKELRDKAIRKGHDASLTDPVLDHLEAGNYINDFIFAEKFSAEKAKLKKWGPVKIRAELLRKGISRSLTERVLRTISDDLSHVQICVDLALKRKRHFLSEDDDLKRKQKVISYLQRRGYTYDMIQQALPEIMSRL